jgi:hypothetical protein
VDRRAPEAVIAALATELEASVIASRAVDLANEAMRAPGAIVAAIELARLVMRSQSHTEEKNGTGGT